MEKLTLRELERTYKSWKRAVIVYTTDSFDREYSLESRSYEINSSSKFFDPYKNGSSLYGTTLDKSDVNVRLDWYFGIWKIDYCYILE